jgi:hypothetical protein
VDGEYILRFDALSEARLARLMAAPLTMDAFYLGAMRYSVSLVTMKAKQNAASRFVRPTGNLLNNIQGYVMSPMLGVVGVTRSVPYGKRREFGFTGMTDSLGRTYTRDPGVFYLRDALVDSIPQIDAAFMTATSFSIRAMVTP